MPPIPINGPTSGSLAFTYTHGLGTTPDDVTVQMSSGGAIWLASPYWDGTYVYMQASDFGLTALLTITLPGSGGGGSSSQVPGGYCSITDVTNAFPAFQRNAPNSIQDTQIESWIAAHGARIDSALMQRGFDPQNPPVPMTQRQITWLLLLNADAAIGELGRALEGNVTLQPGEISLISGRRKNYEAVLEDIRKGRYDAFFGLPTRVVGTAGAESPRHQPPGNRAFWRDWEG